jgi:hypothetical protein
MRAILLGCATALLSFSIAHAKGPASRANGPDAFSVRVVSSAADQVSGGDARLHIEVPDAVPLDQVRVLVNGVDQRDRFSQVPDTRRLTGVIDGLQLGENTVRVAPIGQGMRRLSEVEMTLTNHPITGPIFSGPHQYPFVCTTWHNDNRLGQPIPDDPRTGTRVIVGGQTVGLSRNCSAETVVDFFYRTTGNTWAPYTHGMPRPDNMAQTTTSDGLTVDYIVRQERGTINRFVYSVAMLAPFDEGPASLGRDAWNGKVIFRFDGGVAIGRTQGRLSGGGALYDLGLSQGYAILYSTGTRTNVHYNLQLGGETALMVKERFIELYDEPTYTVAIGGSGGGIQQYVYGQNHPGLLDGGIPQVSYPDMVTQAIHIGDCELTEFFFDVVEGPFGPGPINPKWQTWTNRTLIQGLNASNTLPNVYFGGALGLTECINGWRGLSPLALNPRFGQALNQQLFHPPSAIPKVRWTHFEDIVNIVGRRPDGYARNYWDNVGVQYGLQALVEGNISFDEFAKLNYMIGGWKDEADMVQEGFPFFPGAPQSDFDVWSARNQVIGGAAPAPRKEGDIEAMRAVYRSGLVFMGNIDIPLIDYRPYLEHVLDMHNSHQSFASRKRMLNAKGEAANQVVWFSDTNAAGQGTDMTGHALAVLDEWLMNIRANPAAGVAGNRPPLATDRCFDAAGNEIGAGDNAWAGIIDSEAPGVCTQQFTLYSTSRRVAGGPFEQSIFKCQLIPVTEAVARGFYGPVEMGAVQIGTLQAIFPQGVCDYSKPDMGLPPEWQ